MLSGLSVDYVVRLEQGRADRPSEQVVAALARTLQLSDAERDQLFVAAGLPVPSPRAVPTHIPGSVQRLLARMPDVAVAVWTHHWTLLTANAAWEALLGPRDGRDPNLVVQQFTGTAATVVWDPAEAELFERSLVSDLRATLIRYPQDASVRRLVERLQPIERFARLWSEATVVEYRAKRKTFVHPLVGTVTLDCDVFAAIGTDLRVVTYTAAPGTEDASRFDLIRTVGAGVR